MREFKLGITLIIDSALLLIITWYILSGNIIGILCVLGIGYVINYLMWRKKTKEDNIHIYNEVKTPSYNKINLHNVTKTSSDEECLNYINSTYASVLRQIMSDIMRIFNYDKLEYYIIKKELFLSFTKKAYDRILKYKNKDKLKEFVDFYKDYLISRYGDVSNDAINHSILDNSFMYVCKEKYDDVLQEVIDNRVYRVWTKDMNNITNIIDFNNEINQLGKLTMVIREKEKGVFTMDSFEEEFNVLKKACMSEIKNVDDIVHFYEMGLEDIIFSKTYKTKEELDQALGKYNELFDEIKSELVNEIQMNIMTVAKTKYEYEEPYDDSFMSKYESVESGEEFETFLMDLFEKLGCKCKHTGGTNDQGADLIINKNGKKTCVQAKFYSSQKLGNTPVQEVAAAVNYYKADNGIVVTNYEFTKGAYDLAKANNVKLIDGKELEKLIKKVDDIESIEF